MALFSERFGYKVKDKIPLEGLTESLKNRIWNIYISSARQNSNMKSQVIMDCLGLTIRAYGEDSCTGSGDDRLYSFLNCTPNWFLWYDFIECFLSLLSPQVSTKAQKMLNGVFEEEKSGYRIINKLVTAITNIQELTTIETAIETPYVSVSTHISKALTLYSQRDNPDYENSIKESILAIEAICCIITNDNKATLGDALSRLKESGVYIHSALIQAWSKLYGYTSDENGIRHAGIDFKGVNSEDAKYMLISCSAFVNYLIEKWNKLSSY
jgi:hypothetical protein